MKLFNLFFAPSNINDTAVNLGSYEGDRVGMAVSVPASHAVGRVFVSRSGHTEDHYENDTNGLLACHACFRVGIWQCNPAV